MGFVTARIVAIVALLVLRHATWYILTLRQSLQLRTRTPFPSVTIYTPRYSLLLYILSPHIYPFLQRMLGKRGRWLRYATRGNEWAMKGRVQRQELSANIYWVLSAGGPTLFVSDADMIAQITRRWRDFPKPVEYYKQLDCFGPSILTLEGARWQRLRKTSSPSFSDRNTRLVFLETQQETMQMLEYLSQRHQGRQSGVISVREVHPIMKRLTLHVICIAGFGFRMDWERFNVAPDAVGSPLQSFGEALSSLQDDPFFYGMLPTQLFKSMPFARLRRIGQGPETFRGHVERRILDAQAGQSIKTEDGHNIAIDLLTSMAKSSYHSSEESTELTQDEIVANTFIFSLAGHETTAGTLQTALSILAVEQGIQQELREEVDETWKASSKGETLSYEEDYPKLRQTMAFIFEVLRMFPAIQSVPKKVAPGTGGKTVIHNGQTCVIPEDAHIVLDFIAAHYNPEYWGPDADEFKPSRWLVTDDYSPPPGYIQPSPKHKNMRWHRRGAYLPFSEGVRDCIGRKFAESEMCAVIATLLRHFHIELATEDGGRVPDVELSMARRKAWNSINQRESLLTLRQAKNVPLRFIYRRCHS